MSSFIYQSVSSYSSVSHFVFFVSFICSFVSDLFPLAAQNHLPPTHWPLMCLPHFLPACLPVDQAAGGCADVGTTQALGLDYLEAAMLSASVLDDCRIRLAWRDADNTLQVNIKQAECENCTLLAADMLTSLRNIRKSQTEHPITHCHVSISLGSPDA